MYDRCMCDKCEYDNYNNKHDTNHWWFVWRVSHINRGQYWYTSTRSVIDVYIGAAH